MGREREREGDGRRDGKRVGGREGGREIVKGGGSGRHTEREGEK